MQNRFHRCLAAFAAAVLLPVCTEQRGSSVEDTKTRNLTLRAKQLEATFGTIERKLRTIESSPCSDSAIRAALKKTDNRNVPFVAASVLADFAAGKPVDTGRPLAYLVPQALLTRRPTSQVSDEKSATDAAFDALNLLKEYDYVAALQFELTTPKADGKGFHGGKLEGTLGLFELKSGKAICAAPVFAQSHEEIAGKPGQSPQQAAEKDFELELRRGLQEALRGLTRELNLELK
jgi:hypothetical protein